MGNLVPLTVDRAKSVVSSLVMKRDAKLSLVHLRDLRLGAWSSRQIRVSSTGGKVRGTGGEVVLWKRRNTSADAVSVILGRVVIGLVPTRVE